MVPTRLISTSQQWKQNMKMDFYTCQKCLDGQASHENLGGENTKAIHVQQTRCHCPHSFAGNVTPSYDGVGCLYHQTVGSGSIAHSRWLGGLAKF